MTDQERLDAIDAAKEEATNLTAGLQANGRPEVTRGDSEAESEETPPE